MSDFTVNIADTVFTYVLTDYPGRVLNVVQDLEEQPATLVNVSTPTSAQVMSIEDILALRAAGEAANR